MVRITFIFFLLLNSFIVHANTSNETEGTANSVEMTDEVAEHQVGI